MVRFLWLGILMAALYWAIRELFGGCSQGSRVDAEGEEMVRDPQCGVYVPKSSAVSGGRAGRNLYFCSAECRKKYLTRGKGDNKES